METSDLAVDWSGTILDGRYRILEPLGHGGMGHVYAAEHVAREQRVAIKVLHPRLAENERFRARFLQEAYATSRIRHPNVVAIEDFGRAANGTVYFVMELLRGRDLGVELLREGTLPWPRARSILLQAASALQAAHVQQVIHRDIKPGNCFLLDDAEAGLVDVVKLVDFGIAKVGDPSSKGLTGAGEIIGTVSYMSPEQARSEPLDARSDVYSLGAMAYEMLTGLVPFRGSDALCVIAAHLQEQPEPVRRLAPEVPAAADALVLKMLAKAPQDRYASMEAVVEALRAIPETARGARRTQAWAPMRSPASHEGEQGPVDPPKGSTEVASLASRGRTLVVDEKRTMLLPPEASGDRGAVGGPAGARRGSAWSAVDVTASTEPQLMASDTLEAEVRSWERMRLSSRRFAGLALLGLLVILVGGSTVLVTKPWRSSDGAHEPVGSTAAPRDARAAGQEPPAGRGAPR